MHWLSRWIRRAKLLSNRNRAEREMDDEMRFHLEMEIEELKKSGMSPEAARLEALRSFGGMERYKEEGRDARGTRLFEDLAQDLRYAVRTFRKSPGFTAVALLTLALGVGATTAIFSVVNAVLLRPLPYGAPESVVEIRVSWKDRPDGNLSPAEYLDFRDKLTVTSAVGVYGFGAFNITSDGEPERIRLAGVSTEVFSAFGVSPAFGRVFTLDEEVTGANVALLSDAFWRRRFSASPDVVGRTIILNDTTVEVLGVMPAGFQLPEDVVSGQRVAVYIPIGIDPMQVSNRGSHGLRGVARLKPGVTQAAGARAVERLAEWMVEEFPDGYPEEMQFRATAIPILETVVGSIRPALLVLLGAVGFVLLIVCANLANLLLSRADSRKREFALRAALGADRPRIVRQLLVESSALALGGGLLGLVLALWGTRLLIALRPPNIPRLDEISMDVRVLGFALGISLITGIAFGLLPAVQVSKAELVDSLKLGGRGLLGSRAGERSRRLLVVAEVAFALMLLAGAGLFTRSFLRLYNIDPGFRAENVLTVRISPPFNRYREEERITGFWRDLVRDLSEQPGIIAVGAVRNLPLATRLGDLNFEKEGEPVPEDQVSPSADWQTVTPGYFKAMGMSILRGRGIEASDDANAPGVVVINEETAKRYWPGEDPLGKRFLLGGGAGPGWVSIVGIVRNIQHNGLDAETKTQMYLAHQQFRSWGGGFPSYSMNLVVRTVAEPAAMAGVVRSSVRSVDPALPLGAFRVMEDVVSASVSQPRFVMSLLLAFSALAVVLAAIGIYGVLAYAVGVRTQEFGIRLALGAEASDVATMVVKGGLLLVAVGLAIGLSGALLVTRLLESLLYEIKPSDPVTLIGVSVILGVVALAACYIPAWRATRVDPMVALRAE